MSPTPPPAAPDEANLVSQAEFARRNGWAKSYVTKLKGEGRLVMTDDGKHLLAAESLARIAATTHAPGRASDPATSPAYRSDRDRREFYDAETARLDLEERLGKLARTSEIIATLADAASIARGKLESWGARLTPQIAALGGNEARIRRVIDDQVRLLLQDLSDRFTKAEAAARRPKT